MINALAGTITTLDFKVFLTPNQCLLYESCVVNVLCHLTECIKQSNGDLWVKWIW